MVYSMMLIDAVLCGLVCGLKVSLSRSEAQFALWALAIARPIIYISAFLFPAVIVLQLGSKRRRHAKLGSADGPWSAGSVSAAGPAVLAFDDRSLGKLQLASTCGRSATPGRMQQLILGNEHVAVSSSLQVPFLLPPEVSLREWKGRTATDEGFRVSGDGLCSSLSTADGISSSCRPPKGFELQRSLGFAEPVTMPAHCSSTAVCKTMLAIQPEYAMSPTWPTTPPAMSSTDQSETAVVSPNVMFGISAAYKQSPAAMQSSSSRKFTANSLAPVTVQAATACAASSPCSQLSPGCAAYGTGSSAQAGHADVAPAATAVIGVAALVQVSPPVTAGMELMDFSIAAGCRNHPKSPALLPTTVPTAATFLASNSYCPGIQLDPCSNWQPAASPAAGETCQHAAVVAAAVAAHATCQYESSNAAGAAEVPQSINPCQQLSALLLQPAVTPAAAAAAAVAWSTPPDLTINTGCRKLATHPEQHSQQQHKQEPASARSDMTSEGSVDQPSTPVFLSTSSRNLRHPAGNTSFSSYGLSCGSNSTTGVLVVASPPPLPSPAQSPLARRVTGERDENGFPTSPGLLQLLQEQEQQEQQEHRGHCDQQQVPWAGLQLRCVARTGSAGERHSSDVGAGPPGVCCTSSSNGRVSSSSSDGDGADSLGIHITAERDTGVAVQQTVISLNSSSSWDSCRHRCMMKHQSSSSCSHHAGGVSMPYQQLLAFYETGTRSLGGSS